ncbi:crosslink repair DNA glycosylase YcaQ family protein [Streptomyces sp. NPDC005549]|uniref:DNA glycosylase AlkZ-like family protein n=1 Tax=Streptomyces sp. NPDC005549 TaxID=3154888 RepID=UPI0033A91955
MARASISWSPAGRTRWRPRWRPAARHKPRCWTRYASLLSPWDSLIWHRPRIRRLFGVVYLLETYRLAATRERGYFGMPNLVGTSLAGLLAGSRV